MEIQRTTFIDTDVRCRSGSSGAVDAQGPMSIHRRAKRSIAPAWTLIRHRMETPRPNARLRRSSDRLLAEALPVNRNDLARAAGKPDGRRGQLSSAEAPAALRAGLQATQRRQIRPDCPFGITDARGPLLSAKPTQDIQGLIQEGRAALVRWVAPANSVSQPDGGTQHDPDRTDEPAEPQHDPGVQAGRPCGAPDLRGRRLGLARQRDTLMRRCGAGRLVIGPERRQAQVVDGDLVPRGAAVDIGFQHRRGRPVGGARLRHAQVAGRRRGLGSKQHDTRLSDNGSVCFMGHAHA